jgi:transposase InsO family protein
MPWERKSVSQMREEFVKKVLNGEGTMSELCREYGISRPTGYKWVKRYQSGEAMTDQSRRPNTVRRTSEETERLILDYRTSHPAIGAVKIRKILENKGHRDLPCTKTVNNILKRNGMITREASLAATPFVRFEKETPNEMWQADYKGHFSLRNGHRCHPLNIIDDHSRYNLCCEPMATETYAEIKPVMIRIFQEYGLPRIFLCDNGNPWGTAQSTGFTSFEVWLMDLGILTIHGRILHPQTQGKEESFNRSMTKELLKQTILHDEEDARKQFQLYRRFYNEERPHHALKLDTPLQHYKKSNREYTDEIRQWEYPEGCELRTVKSTGYLTWEGQGYFLSEAFGDKVIAIRKSHIPGCISLFYRQFRIGRIDVENRVFTFKKAFLIHDDPRSWADDGRRNK